MRKETDRFNDYIKAKEKTISQIKCNRNFSDQEKRELVTLYKADIQKIQRLQIALAERELRRTKQRQYIKLHNYETLVNRL